MPSDLVPWRTRSLADVTDSAVDGPFGSNLKTEHYVTEAGVRVVRLQNIGRGSFDDADRAWVSEAHAATLQRHEVRPRDVLVASLGDERHPVARACLYPEGHPPGLVKADCFRLRVNSKLADPGYVMRALNCPVTRKGINGLSQGVTRDRVNLGNLLSFVVSLPPPAEQRRIAEILDTLDEAIRRTEQIVAKLQQMKQGLLHDLLTRGIDEHGEIRDPERRPELFKDSPLGRIPSLWTVLPLGDVVPKAEYGVSCSLSLDPNGGVPVLRMNNLAEGEADTSDLKFSDAPEVHALPLMAGDVLFNRTNSIEHVGRTGIWRGQLPNASFASYLVRLVPDRGRMDPEFLNLWLNWRDTQRRIRQWATPGVQQVNINPTNLRRTLIALPPSLEEQGLAAARVLLLDERLGHEGRHLDKLRSLKNGLTDDLLTGRVRVSVSEEASVA